MLLQRERSPGRTATFPYRPQYSPAWPVAWLVALVLLGVVSDLGTAPPLKYGPEGLASGQLENVQTDGFFAPENDESKTGFVWAKPDTLLKLNLSRPRLLKLTLELRSAAIAGGPDEPVRVLVGDREVGRVHPDPRNPRFQTFQVVFAPPTVQTAKQPLEISLASTPFSPPRDRRVLGTMIRSVSLENGDWSAVAARWQKLIWGLLALSGLTFGLGTLARLRGRRWLGWATVGVGTLSLGGVGWAALTLAPLRTWLSDQNPYSGPSLVLLYVGTLLTLWLLSTPVGTTNLGRWAYRRVEPITPPVERSRLAPLPALTGLRIIAAGLVFLFHAHNLLILPEWVGNFFGAGNIGVPLFFVLSGFVICYNYFPALSQSPLGQSWLFVVARVARIYPMYLFVLLLSLGTVGFESNPARRDLWGGVQHLSVIQAWSPNRLFLDLYVYNGQAWTLTVEFFLYACFPLIAWGLLRPCRRGWQLIGLGIGVYATTVALISFFWFSGRLSNGDDLVYWVNHVPLTHLADFVAGCVAARLYVLGLSKPASRRENRLGSLALYASIGAIVGLMFTNGPAFFEPYRYDLAYLPFFTLLVFGLARYRTPLRGWLGSRPMVRLGEASYSFYLLHQYFLNGLRADPGDGLTIYLYVVMMFGICCLVSLAAYQYIESPARRLIHRLVITKASRHETRVGD